MRMPIPGYRTTGEKLDNWFGPGRLRCPFAPVVVGQVVVQSGFTKD